MSWYEHLTQDLSVSCASPFPLCYIWMSSTCNAVLRFVAHVLCVPLLVLMDFNGHLAGPMTGCCGSGSLLFWSDARQMACGHTACTSHTPDEGLTRMLSMAKQESCQGDVAYAPSGFWYPPVHAGLDFQQTILTSLETLTAQNTQHPTH